MLGDQPPRRTLTQPGIGHRATRRQRVEIGPVPLESRPDLSATAGHAPVPRNQHLAAITRQPGKLIEAIPVVFERITRGQIEQRHLIVRTHIAGDQDPIAGHEQTEMPGRMPIMDDELHLWTVPLDPTRSALITQR